MLKKKIFSLYNLYLTCTEIYKVNIIEFHCIITRSFSKLTQEILINCYCIVL